MDAAFWKPRRRAFLGRGVASLGSLALTQLCQARGAESPRTQLGAGDAARGKARAVICLFQHGGPSQMDLFDPKPELNRRDGQAYQGELEVHFDKQKGNLLGSPYQFRRFGRSGLEISELLPHTGAIADDLCLIRSMRTDSVDHEAALRCIHTGKIQAGRPTWGSWVLYGLGTEREDLPAYVVLSDPTGFPVDGIRNWSSGFLPAVYQGTRLRATGAPVFNLEQPTEISNAVRARQLELLQSLNRAQLERYRGAPEAGELEARLVNFETAARMQTTVPEVLDLSRESEATRRLYGLDQPHTADYGRKCLMARRLVEAGVRFVQIFLKGQPWDTHSRNAETLKGLCAMSDQPSAALVTDLKARGLLESTIVLWAGEFGRLPISQGKDGRDHNRHAFSLWLAGGGFRGGHVHGSTDELGYKSVIDVVPVADLHATLLHSLGLDHRKLVYAHEGREDSLTDVTVTGARVRSELLA